MRHVSLFTLVDFVATERAEMHLLYGRLGDSALFRGCLTCLCAHERHETYMSEWTHPDHFDNLAVNGTRRHGDW